MGSGKAHRDGSNELGGHGTRGPTIHPPPGTAVTSLAGTGPKKESTKASPGVARVYKQLGARSRRLRFERYFVDLAFAVIFCVILDSQADSNYRKNPRRPLLLHTSNFGPSEHAHERDETPQYHSN